MKPLYIVMLDQRNDEKRAKDLEEGIEVSYTDLEIRGVHPSEAEAIEAIKVECQDDAEGVESVEPGFHADWFCHYFVCKVVGIMQMDLEVKMVSTPHYKKRR